MLTDLVMPDMEGIETIRAIRRRFPVIPIVAMSGGGSNQPNAYLDIALRLGAKRAIEKPLNLPALIEVLRETIAQSGSPRMAD